MLKTDFLRLPIVYHRHFALAHPYQRRATYSATCFQASQCRQQLNQFWKSTSNKSPRTTKFFRKRKLHFIACSQRIPVSFGVFVHVEQSEEEIVHFFDLTATKSFRIALYEFVGLAVHRWVRNWRAQGGEFSEVAFVVFQHGPFPVRGYC